MAVCLSEFFRLTATWTPGRDQHWASLFKRYDRRIVGRYRFSIEGKGHSRLFRVESVERSSNQEPNLGHETAESFEAGRIQPEPDPGPRAASMAEERV